VLFTPSALWPEAYKASSRCSLLSGVSQPIDPYAEEIIFKDVGKKN
jgi:hypothetical protein